MIPKLSLLALLLGVSVGVQAHELRGRPEKVFASLYDVEAEEVQVRGAVDGSDECPEGEDMIRGIGCRGDPEGPKPTCPNGQRARRACYREEASWWQCEKDCYLGPPNSSQGRRNRKKANRNKPPADDSSFDFEAEEAARKQRCAHYYLEITCDGAISASETDYKSSQEVRDADVCQTECFDHGGRSCRWRWSAEGCTSGGGGGGNKSSIKCTKPRASRIREEGHKAVCKDLAPRDVMYKCEDGSKLCCTESDMRKVNFKNKDWGTCRRKGGNEAVSDVYG